MNPGRGWILAGFAVLVACTANRALHLEPLRGVGKVTPSAAGWEVEVPGGIGRFRLGLPAGQRSEIVLVYAPGRPFNRLEGVQVIGHPGEAHPAVDSDGSGRLRITSDDTPLDLTLIVIDYYR